MRKRRLVQFLTAMAILVVLVGCGDRREPIGELSEALQEKSSEAEEVKTFTRKPDMELRNNKMELTAVWWLENECDADGVVTKITYYENDTDFRSRVGKKIYWEEYGHDSNGNLVKFIRYNLDGSIEDWKEYDRDSDGNIVKYRIYNSDGSIKESGTLK